MNKLYKILIPTITLFASVLLVSAQTSPSLSPWIYSSPSPLIKPVISSSSVQIPSLASAGLCLTTNASGTLGIGVCGSGSATTTINGVSGPTFTFSSPSSTLHITSSTGNLYLDLASLAISQFTNNAGYLATTTGNWLGTLQGKNATDFAASSTVSSQWTSSSSDIYFLGGRVGIGINTPDNALEVNGTAHILNNLYVNGNTSTTQLFVVATSSFPNGIWNANGSVGIGTTTPATALVVNGAITQTSLGTGLVKSTLGVLGNATSGTDYQSPLTGSILGTAGQVTATANTNSIGTTTTLALATTTVTAGSYTNTNVTVDAYGRITSATTQNLVAGSSTIISTSGTTTTIGMRSKVISMTIPGAFLANEDIPGVIIPTTSTIKKVSAATKAVGDSLTFNLIFKNEDCNSATSTAWHAFTSDWAVASTTVTSTQTFASSTINAGTCLRFYTSAASSSATSWFNATLLIDEN